MPENKINPERVFAKLLDEIVAAKGAGLGKVERLNLRQELQEQLDDKIDEAIVMALPEDRMLELDKIIDTASEEEITKFFDQAGVDFAKVTLEATLKFRQEQLGIAPTNSANPTPTAETATAAAANPAQAAPVVAAETAPVATAPVAIDSTVTLENPSVAQPSTDQTQNTNPAPNPTEVATAPNTSNVEGIARMIADMTGGENHA